MSLGTDKDFGNEDEYFGWLEKHLDLYREGFVLMKENGTTIGQLELTVRRYEGNKIGYVNLFYLIQKKREGV
ncbi:hypothetical protein [Peribacillus butanolivorans]